MLTYMLDTNICIYVMKTYLSARRPREVQRGGGVAMHIEHRAWGIALWRGEVRRPRRWPRRAAEGSPGTQDS